MPDSSPATAEKSAAPRSQKSRSQPKPAKQRAAPLGEPLLDIGGKAHKAEDLQRTAGNQAVTRAIESGAALPIGPPHDRYEQDAARTADEAVNSRQGLAAYFESRFGLEMDRVRLHHGDGASEAARSVGAKAFTAGKDIVFAAGRYNPTAREGQRLLAHELTHVVQQKEGAIAGPVIQREPDDKPVPFGPKYEQKRARLSSFEKYKADIGSSDYAPPIQAASQFTRSDATARAGESGTKITPIEISLRDLQEIMNPPGQAHNAQLDKILAEYRGSINLAFQTMQMDTAEAQALYLAHAAGETGSFLKLEEKTIQAKSYKGFEGRGPVQVTGEYNYVQTIAYLEKDAELLRNSANPEDQYRASRAQEAANAIRADPAAAADPRHTFLFSAAFMQMAGGIRRSPRLKGQKPQFPGNETEDSWVSGNSHATELASARKRLASAKAAFAAMDPGAAPEAVKAAKALVKKESNAVQEWESTISRSAVKAATFERALKVLSRKDVNNPARQPEPEEPPATAEAPK
jgi:hypothetical protein